VPESLAARIRSSSSQRSAANMNRDEIEARIIRDPTILVGKPVVRGTRIPVSLILNYMEHGHSVEELLDDYPVLTREDIEAAVTYGKQQQELLDVGTD
jgi:uncharacterized protein (DUF433 family)